MRFSVGYISHIKACTGMWHFASYLISGCVLGKVLCDLCSNQNNYGHKLHMQNWAEVGVLTHLPVPLGNCWFLTKGLSQTPACSGCLLSLCFSTFLSSSREIERKKKNKEPHNSRGRGGSRGAESSFWTARWSMLLLSPPICASQVFPLIIQISH